MLAARGGRSAPALLRRALAPMATNHYSAAAAPGPADTIFGKILRKEIPSAAVYEDDKVYAFRDITPQAPTHIVLIPRKPIPQISKAEDDDQELLGYLLLKARDIARQEGLDDGYRLVINSGRDGGQTVYHLHVHILYVWLSASSLKFASVQYLLLTSRWVGIIGMQYV